MYTKKRTISLARIADIIKSWCAVYKKKKEIEIVRDIKSWSKRERERERARESEREREYSVE